MTLSTGVDTCGGVAQTKRLPRVSQVRLPRQACPRKSQRCGGSWGRRRTACLRPWSQWPEGVGERDTQGRAVELEVLTPHAAAVTPLLPPTLNFFPPMVSMSLSWPTVKLLVTLAPLG